MANLPNFHVVFSSTTLIRLNKDTFEGHLCQTVNNFVEQNISSLLSPLRKRRPPQHIKHTRNTRVSRLPTFEETCCSTLHPLTLSRLYFGMGPIQSAILHKKANQRKVSSLLKLLWAALQVATQNESLELALFVIVVMCLDHSKSLLRVTPKYLASMTFSSTCMSVRS